jgi:hypothetical protein
VRSDMAKVLVERPRGGRYGSIGKGYRKELQRTPVEEMRTREGIKARWRSDRKWFNDHLGPLRRFLLSNVGRPWDIIHSEICQAVGKGFPTREHFFTHVYQFVRRSVILVDGVPCQSGGFGHGSPLVDRGGRCFYVCPASGLLRKAPGRRKPRT